MSERLGLSLAAGCTSAALLYSILRVASAWLVPEPPPELLLAGEHSGFFWRAWTCAYAGGTVAFVVWLLCARGTERPARVLAKSVVPVAILVTLQAAFVP